MFIWFKGCTRLDAPTLPAVCQRVHRSAILKWLKPNKSIMWPKAIEGKNWSARVQAHKPTEQSTTIEHWQNIINLLKRLSHGQHCFKANHAFCCAFACFSCDRYRNRSKTTSKTVSVTCFWHHPCLIFVSKQSCFRQSSHATSLVEPKK
jgi:hypothetical protein